MRLKSDADFSRLLKNGRRLTLEGLVLYVCRNGLSYARLGIRVSKRIKPAVRRNYLKRCVREVFRRWLKHRLVGQDVLVLLTAEASFHQIKDRLIQIADLLVASR